MRNTIIDHSLRAAVRGQLLGGDVRNVVAQAAQDRVEILRHDSERGAQAAEYAMLGGVSAAACGGLIAILNNTNVIQRLVDAVFNSLVSTVSGWF